MLFLPFTVGAGLRLGDDAVLVAGYCHVSACGIAIYIAYLLYAYLYLALRPACRW